jgi:hypothetical protein
VGHNTGRARTYSQGTARAELDHRWPCRGLNETRDEADHPSIQDAEARRHSAFLVRTIHEASNVLGLRRSFGTVPIRRHGSIVTTILHRTQSPLLLTDKPFAFRHLSCESRIVNRLERSMRCSRADKGIEATQRIAISDPHERNSRLDGRAEPATGAPNGNRGQADKKHRGGSAMSENSGSCTGMQIR